MIPAVPQAWPELIATALPGTSRRQRQVWPAPGITERADGDGETTLLDAAALAQAARLAGARPIPGSSPSPAGTDRLLPPSERAVQLLELVLTQSPAGSALRPALLQDWCHCAAAAGQRLPHHLLPTLFQLTTVADSATILAVQGVLDERGRWLAGQFPQRSKFRTDEPGTELDLASWPTIPTTQRATLLQEWRQRDPGAARELLASTWSSEPARDRAALLAALTESLSMADEDFLEAALDDRASSVRQQACALLDRLPQSRRAARMADRLTPLISRSGMLRKNIQLEPPAEPDEAAQRDGISTPSTGSRTDQWLIQIITAAPLSVWDSVGGPDGLRGISDGAVVSGLIAAARLQRNQPWARVLMKRQPSTELLTILDAAEQSEWIEALLRHAKHLPSLLGELPGPWAEAPSAAICQALIDKRQTGGDQAHFARSLHPRVAADLLNRVDRTKHQWLAKAISDSYNYHSVRRSIQEAFHD